MKLLYLIYVVRNYVDMGIIKEQFDESDDGNVCQ